MNTPEKNMSVEKGVSASEVRKLISIMEEVAKGNYSNDIMEFTKTSHSETIQRVAEAMGMMMVKVEAREHRLGLMIEELKELNALLKKNIIQTVTTIAHALGARDKYTEGHAQRVAVYSRRLASRVGLTEEEIENIAIGGTLHDIGKIGFSDRVFSDEDVHLSKEIFDEIHRHPSIGVSILKDLDFLEPILECVHCHHERLDGTGYPRGLTVDKIPLGARIISIADVFDAITTDRPYKKGKSRDEAFAVLIKLSGTDLSPELVDAFIAEIKENGML